MFNARHHISLSGTAPMNMARFTMAPVVPLECHAQSLHLLQTPIGQEWKTVSWFQHKIIWWIPASPLSLKNRLNQFQHHLAKSCPMPFSGYKTKTLVSSLTRNCDTRQTYTKNKVFIWLILLNKSNFCREMNNSKLHYKAGVSK